LEVPEGELAAAAAVVRAQMEGAAPYLHVPIPVNIHVGRRWGDMQPLPAAGVAVRDEEE
jgi:DNA polymerase I-like protein with 3'-5' exonuclease and polymerase domains